MWTISSAGNMGALLALLLVGTFLNSASGHLFMDMPNCRGGLRSQRSTVVIDPNAPIDYSLHFPAGDKSQTPGSALRSQIAAGANDWVPFEPLKRGFRWRAGVCGDLVTGDEHLRGGKYYFPTDEAMIVKTYKPGDIIEVKIQVVAHHNGFVELHLCDVTKCSGRDISEDCFNKGHCIQLPRARNSECDGGMSKECGPIDRKFPGRWYIPCSKNNKDGVWESYGPSTATFQIPRSFSSEHAVLQFFSTGANSCNPPGVIEYFDGPDAPRNWGSCPGQGGARGGVARQQRPCGGSKFPEEYLLCSDIAVIGATTADTEEEATVVDPDASASASASPSEDAIPSESASAVPSESVSPIPSQTPVPSADPSQEASEAMPSESPTPIPSASASAAAAPRRRRPTASTSSSPLPSESSTPRPSRRPARASRSPSPTPSEPPALSSTTTANRRPRTTVTPEPTEEPTTVPRATRTPKPTSSDESEPSPTPEERTRVDDDGNDETEGVLKKLKENPDRKQQFGGVKGVWIVSAGKVLGEAFNGDVIDGTTLPELTFEAETSSSVSSVRFELRSQTERWVSIARTAPFRMFEDSDAPYWEDIVLDEPMTLYVTAGRDRDKFKLEFVSKI